MATASNTPWTPASERSLQSFLRTEAGSSSLLLAAAIVALVWANSPWGASYDDLWATKLTIDLGGAELSESLKDWTKDGLMVLFFYVVGLEIRRELALGELRDRGKALVPALAALGGMVAPALIYLAINPTGEAARGWGVVMATDIAFVLGGLAILGRWIPPQLRVFLLTLAIIDDIGAIAVIAVFYSDEVSLPWLGAAIAIAAAIGVGRRFAEWRGPVYFLAALPLWLATYESGVHPTLAGVALGVLTAVHPPRRSDVERATTFARRFRQSPTPASARSTAREIGGAVSANERFQHGLHPWTSYVVVPIFALANAGVDLGGGKVGDALSSPVTLGVVLGLVGGKLVGVSLASLLALRLPATTLPYGVGKRHLPGAGLLAGIGFTVSLFVAELAFGDTAAGDEATVGILLASLLAATLGAIALRIAARSPKAIAGPATAGRLVPDVERRHDHVRGDFGAPLVLVEYADFECPFCGSATGVVEELRERLGEDLLYVFRHLPNPDLHPHAQLAAEAVEAAGAQGRFWEMHDRVFGHQDRLQLDDFLGDAQALDLDVERFAEDLRDGVHAAAIEADVTSAQQSGVSSTPTFFVNGRRHDGPWDAETLTEALRASRDAPQEAASAD